MAFIPTETNLNHSIEYICSFICTVNRIVSGKSLHRWQKYCWLCHFASLFHQQISISTIMVQSRLIHMRLLLIRNGVKVNCIFMMRARLALILALKWNPNYVHGLDYVSP